MQFQLGKFFRRRYDKLIGPGYSSKKVYYRSSNTSRTIQSAQFNAAGLFGQTVPARIFIENINDWQTVPIHTVPLDGDYLVYQSIPCAKADKQHNEYVKSLSVMSEFRKHRNFFQFLEENSGAKIRTISDFGTIAEALIIEHGRGLP